MPTIRQDNNKASCAYKAATNLTQMPFRPSREGDRVNLLHPQKSEKLLSLALTYGSPRQWGEWLRLPLVGAAVEGDAALVKELLAAGADGSAGQMNTDGSTLLHAAADGGSEQVRFGCKCLLYGAGEW